MKTFFAPVIALVLGLAFTPAHAATYNFNSTLGSVEMFTTNPNGFLMVGDNGTVNTATVANHQFDSAGGVLGAGTGINFTYDLTAATAKSATTVVTPYFNGTPSTIANVKPSDFSAPFNLGYSLIPGTSETTISQLTATRFMVTIANLSTTSPLFFTSMLNIMGEYFKKGGDVATSFNTFAVAQTPLPAALPMFGLGLLGLAGYRRMKKRA